MIYDEMFSNFSEREINGVKICNISNQAYNIYKTEARRDANIPRDVLEVKLTAMIMSTNIIDIVCGKLAYKFGGFCITVNPRTNKIETVNWVNENHRNYGDRKKLTEVLTKNYLLLGLNEEGNAYASELTMV